MIRRADCTFITSGATKNYFSEKKNGGHVASSEGGESKIFFW
jgi:hypothetical protein